MIYGRVIGNELRDIPPECFPIWGQRWSGYRAPHGPSPFSTRTLSADQMTEVGPVLTSPTQFEAAFAEDDEWEDARSESSQPYSTFSSSPLTNQVATELTPQPGTPTPRFVRFSPNHLYSSPRARRRSIGNPPPQDSTYIGTLLLPRGNFEYPGTQHHTSEYLFRTSVPPRDGILGQGGCRTLENDYASSDVGRSSSSTQLQPGPSQGNSVPSEQMQCTMPSYSIPEWQLANAHTQSLAYSFQPDPLPHLSQPFHADSQTNLDSTPPQTSSCFSARDLPRHNHDVGMDSSWNHESSTTTIPGITPLNNPMMTQWSSELVPSDLSFSPPLQIPEPSFDLGSFYPLVSDHLRDSSDPEYLLSTFPVGSPTLLSLDRLRNSQHTG